jgi:hypothetical protein
MRAFAVALLSLAFLISDAFVLQPTLVCRNSLSERLASCTTRRAQSRLSMSTEGTQDPRILRAENLVTALKDDLPQLFDLSYTPRWDLYDPQV